MRKILEEGALSLYIGVGTWQNSELLPCRELGLGKFWSSCPFILTQRPGAKHRAKRGVNRCICSETWKNYELFCLYRLGQIFYIETVGLEKIQSSFLYKYIRLWDLEKFRSSSPALERAGDLEIFRAPLPPPSIESRTQKISELFSLYVYVQNKRAHPVDFTTYPKITNAIF